MLTYSDVRDTIGTSDSRLNKVFSSNCAAGFVYDNVLVSRYSLMIDAK